MAKKAVGEIVPLTDDFLIRDLLKETDEAAAVISAAGVPPFGGVRDVKRSVRYAEKGGVLSMKELLDILSSLRTAAEVRNFFEKGSFRTDEKSGNSRNNGAYRDAE